MNIFKEITKMMDEDKQFAFVTKIQQEIIHQKAMKQDEEVKSIIAKQLEEHPEIRELWEKEQKERTKAFREGRVTKDDINKVLEKGETNGIHED